MVQFSGSTSFSKLLGNATVCRSLLRMLCRRCRDAWAQIEVLSFKHSESRIRFALYQLCQSRGLRTGGRVRIELPLTHQQLADLTGIARETATRALGNLQSEGVIKVENHHFLVFDPEQLIESVMTD